MVRVLLDATAIPADRRGVGRHLDNLVPALVAAGVDLSVVCKPEDGAHFGELSKHDPVVAPAATRSRPARLLWEQAGLPRLVARAAPDVLHSPHYTHPALAKVPLVISLYDATFFTDPEVHTRVKGPFFRTATRLALRRAACCVVPSQSTADQLARVAGADPARLHVAYLGVDAGVFAPPSREAVAALRGKLGLPGGREYVAFLGTLEPRKNIPALIRGWVAACRGRTDPPALVIAGGSGWDDQVADAIAAVPAGLTIVRPGYLPQDELAALLGGATVVAYPSLAEGFGLPVLEAMACGAPVLTTRRTSLPEVGGDAVAYTETDDVAIGAALAELFDDPGRRAALAAAGVRRAAEFTWDACAQAHLIAYQQAMREGRRKW